MDVAGIDDQTGKLYILTDRFFSEQCSPPTTQQPGTFDNEPLAAHPQHSISGSIPAANPATSNRFWLLCGWAAAKRSMSIRRYVLHTACLKQAYSSEVSPSPVANDDSPACSYYITVPTMTTYHILSDRKEVTTLAVSDPDRQQADRPATLGHLYRPRRTKDSAILDLPAGWKEAEKPRPALVHPARWPMRS